MRTEAPLRRVTSLPGPRTLSSWVVRRGGAFRRTPGRCGVAIQRDLAGASRRPTITDGTYADHGRGPVGNFPFIVVTGVPWKVATRRGQAKGDLNRPSTPPSRSPPPAGRYANMRSCRGFAAPAAPNGPRRGTGSTARIRKIRMLSGARRAGSGTTRPIRPSGSASGRSVREKLCVSGSTMTCSPARALRVIATASLADSASTCTLACVCVSFKP